VNLILLLRNNFVSDIAVHVFVLKRDVKLQPTNQRNHVDHSCYILRTLSLCMVIWN